MLPHLNEVFEWGGEPKIQTSNEPEPFNSSYYQQFHEGEKKLKIEANPPNSSTEHLPK